jgi:DNA-binding SARP family transcriptional activator
MRLYAVNGNRTAAMRVYQNCVSILKRDLGVGPSSLTQNLYRKLLTAEESYQFA